MTIIDRARIESAILRYDFWLEMRGVRGSRRRDFGCVLTAIAFTSGVEASGATGREVSGAVFPWFGVDYTAQVDPGRSYSAGAGGIGGYLLGLPLVTFVLVAQPWRLLRRGHRAAATTSSPRA